MKPTILSLLILFGIAACQPYEGKKDDFETSDVRSLPEFTGISVSESINLELAKGNKNSARIETDGIDVEEVMLEVNGSKLKVHLRDHGISFWFFRDWKSDVKVYLTYTEDLNYLHASSSSDILSKEVIEGEKMRIEISSSAKADLWVDADELNLHCSSSGKGIINTDSKNIWAEVSSSGKLVLSGEADFQDIQVSSSGSYQAFDLKSNSADAQASSSGLAELTAFNALDADASSSGKIKYRGNPNKLNVHSSSSGSINKVD